MGIGRSPSGGIRLLREASRRGDEPKNTHGLNRCAAPCCAHDEAPNDSNVCLRRRSALPLRRLRRSGLRCCGSRSKRCAGHLRPDDRRVAEAAYTSRIAHASTLRVYVPRGLPYAFASGTQTIIHRTSRSRTGPSGAPSSSSISLSRSSSGSGGGGTGRASFIAQVIGRGVRRLRVTTAIRCSQTRLAMCHPLGRRDDQTKRSSGTAGHQAWRVDVIHCEAPTPSWTSRR